MAVNEKHPDLQNQSEVDYQQKTESDFGWHLVSVGIAIVVTLVMNVFPLK